MKDTGRLYLLDILKLMTLVSIAILHANEFIFYEDVFPLGTKAPVYYFSHYGARFFTIGGQVLVGIIFLLFGLTQKSQKSLLSISVFAFIGQLILTVVYQAFEWDIYIYLSVTTLLIALTPFFYRRTSVLIPLSFLMMWIPPGLIQEYAPDTSFFHVLTGKLTDNYTGSWPLMPQFFLALLFYQVGLYMRERRSQFNEMKRNEIILWSVLFVLSLPFLGAYYMTPIGPHYYEFVFNKPPHIFWANFLPFVFMMRLSFLTSIQEKLAQSGLVKKISQLSWNRDLGITYLISIIYLGIGMYFRDYFYQSPLSFDLYLIALMPVSEFLARLTKAMLKSKT